MDQETQSLYDSIRSLDGWILGLGRLGPINGAGASIKMREKIEIGSSPIRYPYSTTWWRNTYDGHLPACLEFEITVQWGYNQVSPELHQRRAFLLAKQYAATGGIPMFRDHADNFTVPMRRGSKKRPGSNVGSMYDRTGNLDAVLPGGKQHKDFIEHFSRLALQFKEFGEPCIYRPFHEMNGTWFWWGGNPEKFVKMWRLVFDIFKKHKVKNVAWCWSPSVGPATQHPQELKKYYPGNEYVDILAADDYFVSKTMPAYTRDVMKLIAELADDKPLFFGELGPISSAEFYQYLPRELTKIPRCRGLMLWLGRNWEPWRAAGAPANTGSLIDLTSPESVMTSFKQFLDHPMTISLDQLAAAKIETRKNNKSESIKQPQRKR